ncbi:MAG TPA: YSC84-related protein [Kofleriaceae bacterium]|nr:YSC84-related protein [Kofleriaceae bacterium]
MRNLFGAATLALALCACATSAPSAAKQRDLEAKADTTLSEMQQKDPSLTGVLQSSAAYAVFPSIGAAGALYVGGAYGKGILYEGGRPAGYVELKQGSAGLTIGGQTYAEVLALQNPNDVAKLKSGKFDLGANVGATVLTAGAAAAANFTNGQAVFINPHGGLMGSLTVTGQTISYRPLAG